MTFAATAVGVAAAGVAANVGTSLASSSDQSKATGQARKAQQRALAQTVQATDQGAMEAHKALQPFARGGVGAYGAGLAESGMLPTPPAKPERGRNESARSYQAKLADYRDNLIQYGRTYGLDVSSLEMADAPSRRDALKQFRQDLKEWRRGGKQGDRPDKQTYLNAYRTSVQSYGNALSGTAQGYDAANSERRASNDLSSPEARSALFRQDAGYYAPVNDMESFRRDPGYAPMVYDEATWRAAGDPSYTGPINTLADLEANDPGYRFRLEQGNKGIETSAAARGSVLSGATLKALARYGSDYAAQEYDAAWKRRNLAFGQAFERGQGAYQSAVGRGQNALTNFSARQNAFTGQQNQNTQFYAGLGQQAAMTQADISQRRADTIGAAASGNGNNQANLSLLQGQNQANLYSNLNSAAQGGLSNVAFDYYLRNGGAGSGYGPAVGGTNTLGGSNGITVLP